jgi:hypothetical protein
LRQSAVNLLDRCGGRLLALSGVAVDQDNGIHRRQSMDSLALGQPIPAPDLHPERTIESAILDRFTDVLG